MGGKQWPTVCAVTSSYLKLFEFSFGLTGRAALIIHTPDERIFLLWFGGVP